MPRIRKKTSNRVSTNHRARIKQKVAESRKKSKKAAKNNPQWKSKHKKDPGIPSSFPYKDQILAEIVEQRRQVAEEKQRRKDEKKAGKAAYPSEKLRGSVDEGSDGEGTEIVFDGISGVKGNAKSRPKESGATEVEVEEETAPKLIYPDLPNLQFVLDQADVVLHILDARDPLSHRSSHLEELIATKPGLHTLLVLNKIDTCPRESITSWLSHFRNHHSTLLFRSASAYLPSALEPLAKGKGKTKARFDDGLGIEAIISYLEKLAEDKGGEKPIVVAVVGLTNSGKTSFVNSLLRKPVLTVYKLISSPQGPTTTNRPQEVVLDLASGKHVRLIDTPGLSWDPLGEQSIELVEARRARDILLRNKGRIDRLKDPSHAVAQIIARANTEDLMLLYNIPAFTQGDCNSFLSGVARAAGLVKKRGVLDLTSASRMVLRDWNRGKFPWYTTAPQPLSTVSFASGSKFAEIYAKDEAILSNIRTRKEMRKDGGAVKFLTGSIDDRKVAANVPWVPVDGDDDSTGSDEDEDNEDEGDSVDDEENDIEKGHDQPAQVILTSKQKRKRQQETALPPNKKVTFSPIPRNSKQSTLTRSHKVAPMPQSKLMKASQTATSNLTGRSKQTSVANAVTKKVPPCGTAEGGAEAYDFGKFF